MKKHYYVMGGIIAVALVGLLLILLTTPAKPANNGKEFVTATPDSANSLSLGNLGQGQLVFSREGMLWSWRGATAKRLGIQPGASVVANYSVRLEQPALSPDGTKVAFIRQDESFSDLWVANADGSSPRSVTGHKASGTPRSPNFVKKSLWAFSPTWSPDGAEIAYLTDNGTDDLAVWATSLNRFQLRGISRQLGIGQGGVLHPVWSPVGNSFVVAAYENGKSQIFSIKETTGAIARLTNVGEGAYDPAVSPDGKTIAYVVRKGSGSEIWTMASDGNNQIQLAAQNSRNPVWSPDGKRLAFLSLKGSGFEVFSLDPATNKIEQLSDKLKLAGPDGISWGR